ncbi:serine hydrolase [Planosporangium thailandense]|uniref:Serine hydrolase n=1 Tax=Planosporangium thailandense TaxID=765197 RepID=A0ABX0XUS9_9ACTN|nr:serine hydrolase [Planosporangium thailandense]NJC69087.1 serine hydrolase [Planosporangium thailandense]
MRRNPLVITAGALVLTVAAVVAVKYARSYESPAVAGAPTAIAQSPDHAAVANGPPDAGAVPSARAQAGDPAAQQRFEAAAELVKKANGHLGVAIRDRRTGTEWRAGELDRPSWASSTVKLAMAANLLERGRNGEIKLDTTARKNIADMLENSSDTAADALWDRYGKDGFVPWFQQQYGMVKLQFAAGAARRWNTLTCVPDDLLHLVTYVLDRADPGDRDYLMAATRRAGAAQHWGVWAAGAPNQPGVTNGWALETDDKVKHWVTDSVGFAGPEARYAIAIMFDQPPGGTLDAGVHTASDVIATALGAKTPADVTVPSAATR